MDMRDTIRNHMEEVRSMMYQRCPNLKSLCYPKDLTRPMDYGDPEDLELSAFVGATVCARGVSPREDVTSYSCHVISSLLIRYQVPTYFVSRELCEALLKTEAPDDLLFSDIKFPMPAMIFMLPSEFSRLYFGWPTPFITVGVVPENAVVQSPLVVDGSPVRKVEIFNKVPFFLTTMIDYEEGLPMHYDARCPLDRQVKDLMHNPPFHYYKENATEVIGTEEENRRIVNRLSNLGINILLAMTAEPELITPERIIRAAKKDGKRVVRRALWKPNFIGEHFRISYERADAPGTHRSPYAHWRRGHWRNQRYGEKLSLVKRLWIQPVFVGLQAEHQ